MKSLILVGIQILGIGILAMTTKLSGLTLAPTVFISLGLSIGFVAIFEMKKSKLSLFPDVSREAKLITTGIYKYIRHPMYTSVLAVCLGLLLSGVSLLRLGVFLVLLVDICVKIRFEEGLLEKRFAEYKSYKESSKKLVPYIL